MKKSVYWDCRSPSLPFPKHETHVYTLLWTDVAGERAVGQLATAAAPDRPLPDSECGVSMGATTTNPATTT